MGSVVLYSMYVTPLLASEASLQVLFDLATQQAREPQGAVVSQGRCEHRHESIHRAQFLRLSIQIAAASPCNMQLSLCTMEWLIGLCDDSLENIAKVFEAVGIVPFLLLLSLWSTAPDMQLVEEEEGQRQEGGAAEGAGLSEYTIRMPCAPLTREESARIAESSRSMFNDSVHSNQPEKLAKLQVRSPWGAGADVCSRTNAFDVMLNCTNYQGDGCQIFEADSNWVRKNGVVIVISDWYDAWIVIIVCITRLLRPLYCRSNGELPSIRVAAAAQSPTGFSLQHMQSVLNFIAYTME
jgi:hypothetical protein